jgi:predicted O-methyltransferase YrrM
MADSSSRSGDRYATPAILEYINRIHVAHDAGLARAFSVPDGIPAIQVGPNEGKLLGLLLRLARATKVVEVGTLVGYSSIHMARALPPGGHVWTVEYEPTHADVARANFAAAGVADRVSVHVGAAVDVLPTLAPNGPFDAVFIDADKQNYHLYGRWALANVRSGGLILGDNAYVFGELLDDSDRGRSMRTFHEEVAAACDSVCIPSPDGLVLAIKR